ncbi:L-cystine transport system permease protein tcyB [Cedecea lapagei]|uniref:L-cystine transport system permease protein tcyB n=1 Tax=Cedecea lapagei TaxID=158823 RepID=A0A447V040_9ENTR|nr:L-cystine transport system permease protein tcyB [Cedecea lapagei]
MTTQLDFAGLLPYWPELLSGLWVTLGLTFMATVGGVAIGITGAAIRSGKPGLLSLVWGGYVELIRNTPFVVQLFFIVFGLPVLGLKLNAGEAALIAMLINLGLTAPKLFAPGFRLRRKGSGKPPACWA